ncbi:hypothetical protein [Lysobacter gummosus]|uniref:hypothetical protein n=1 Tax=Lysobacter gummosus TaxID=262324 RepID=UPI00362E1830
MRGRLPRQADERPPGRDGSRLRLARGGVRERVGEQPAPACEAPDRDIGLAPTAAQWVTGASPPVGNTPPPQSRHGGSG